MFGLLKVFNFVRAPRKSPKTSRLVFMGKEKQETRMEVAFFYLAVTKM